MSGQEKTTVGTVAKGGNAENLHCAGNSPNQHTVIVDGRFGVYQLTNSEFMATVFGRLEPSEYCWTNAFIESPNSDGAKWSGKPVTPEHCEDTPALNTYFSVAVLQEVEATRKRRKSHFSRLACVVLDDSNGCALTPSWRFATSDGKEQTGYRLTVPESDVEVATRLHDALTKGGLIPADKNGNNPVRYVRLPVGTNTKYTPAFKHKVLDWNPETTYTLDEVIEALGFDVDLIRNGKPKNNGTSVAVSDDRQSDAELIRLIQTAESYHGPLLTYSARLAQRGMNERSIVDMVKGLMESASDDSERWRQRYADIPRQVKSAVEKFAPPEDPIAQALLQNPTQDNVALIFRQQLAGKLIFAHLHSCWYEWSGTHWQREETRKAFDFARTISRKVNREGKANVASAAFCKGVEEFARADRAFAIEGKEFDQDNYLLNTPAGTFDLRTNTLCFHDPDDRITHVTTVAPTPEHGERFMQFLQEVTGGDDSLIRFLQVSLGACLSGACESHWLLFWTGTGRNGKNTLGDLVAKIMGGYAKKIQASTLMAKSHEAHPTEIATMLGARLVTASEVNQGAWWDEPKINELTGDETLAARFMRGDIFNFKRTHKHLIYGNHRPRLRAVTEALKARIKIVPFAQSFAGREDPTLPAKLEAESGYVLYWLIEGHAEWMRLDRKLPPCVAVERESAAYFDSQTTPDAWRRERTESVNPDDRKVLDLPKASELYNDYHQWKISKGEQPSSLTTWSDCLKDLTQVRSSGVRYRGIQLKADTDDFEVLDAGGEDIDVADLV